MPVTAKATSRYGAAVVIFLAVLLVPLLATVNALVGPFATLPYLAIASMVALLALPLDVVVIGCFALAAVVAGLADYFGHVSQGFWLPYLMGALFALRAVGERLRLSSRRPPARLQLPRPGNFLALAAACLALLYLTVALFSTTVALAPLPQLIVASKNYLFMWGLLLVLLWGAWRIESSARVWTVVILVACLQLPVVIYQRLFVAARRHDVAAWDAVVGTLGGNPESGGHSAAMALICCCAVAVLLLRMRDGRLRRFPGWLMVLVCVVPLAAAEVKAGFVWLTVVFLFFFARTILKEPLRALSTLLVGVVILAGIGWVYKATLYEGAGSRTWSQIYDQQIKYALDPHEYRSDLKRLGRATSVVHWWQQHDLAEEPVQTLFGHGLGASRSTSTFGVGELARRFSIAVDVTGLSTLLWDVGLVGASAFLLFLLTAAGAAYRLSRQDRLPSVWRESAFMASVALAMIALGVFYNRDAIDHPAVQMLLFFSVAHVFLARRALQADGSSDQSRVLPVEGGRRRAASVYTAR